MNNKFLIKEIFDTDLDKNSTVGDLNSFDIRRASRGVLIKDNKIALLNVTKHNYHKLPGGGIEKGETPEDAFKRELLEEVGSDCETLDQGGIIMEWRSQFKLLQISYVFLAKVVGETGKNKLEQSEIDEGFEIEWVSFNKVDSLLENDYPNNYEGNFIKERDKSIIKYYKDKLV